MSPDPVPSLWRREPVLVTAAAVGVLTALSTALLMVGAGTDWPTALGTAIAQLGAIVGGGKVAQTQAWSPARVEDQFLDAETVFDG